MNHLPPQEAATVESMKSFVDLLMAAAPSTSSELKCTVHRNGTLDVSDSSVPVTAEMQAAAKALVSHMMADASLLFNGVEVTLKKTADAAWEPHVKVIS